VGIATLLILAAAAAPAPQASVHHRTATQRGAIQFDLAEHAQAQALKNTADDDDRWMLHDIDDPGASQGKPMFRWKLTKVKFRVPLPSI
jgi:hypothetical protein